MPLLFTFLFLLSSLFAKENELIYNIQPELVSTVSRPDYIPKVNVISGEYCEEAIDLVIAGCEPLSVRRFYYHLAPKDLRCGSWILNPEVYSIANLDYGHKGTHQFASLGDETGAIYYLTQRHDVSVSESNPFSSNRDLIAANKFTIDIGANSYSNLTAEGLSGQGDPKNFSMVYWRWTSPKNNKFFSWKGYIRDGSGRTKEFFTEAYEWHKPHTKSFKKDFNTYTFDLPPRNWLPCHLFICKEVLPNGNILKYEYSPWRGSKLCPTPFNLQQITAYDSKEEKILARIDFDYQKYSWTHHLDIGGTHQKYEIKVEENRGFGIHGSDGRKAYCQHNKRHNLSRPIVLENVNTPTHDIHYNYNIKNWRLVELDRGSQEKIPYRIQFRQQSLCSIRSFRPKRRDAPSSTI